MMKTPLRLSVHPARFFSLSPGRRLALLSLLCLLLLVLPLLAYGLLDIWVSQTPLADRHDLLQRLPWLNH